MKARDLLCVLAGVAGLVTAAGAAEPVQLKGANVVVRLYNDWDLLNTRYGDWLLSYDQPEPFETVTIDVEKESGVLDIAALPGARAGKTVVVILPDDQTDAVVQHVLAESFLAKVYSTGLTLRLRQNAGRTPKPVKILDATGQPMAGATVDLYLSDFRNATKVKVRSLVLDKEASMTSVRTGSLDIGTTLVVSHPDYGKAMVRHANTFSSNVFTVPLVKAGSETYEHSIHGVVVDPAGRPVPDVLLSCSYAIAAGGTNLQFVSDPQSLMTHPLTDAHGRFLFYRMLDENKTVLAEVPTTAEYVVSMQPPDGLGFMPRDLRVSPGEQARVVLERPAAYFRTFSFADANGTITDPNVLEQTCVKIERQEEATLTIIYHRLKDGIELPLGRYKVDAYGVTIPEFEPIEVTAESPEHLVFMPKSTTPFIYSAKVINGTTHQPMADAFIAVGAWLRKDLSNLTPNQWQMLEALGPVTTGDDPCLAPLQEIIRFQKLLRTDSRGVFELPLLLRENQYSSLIVFGSEFTAAGYDLSGEFQHKAVNRRIELPDIPIYPSATVVFEPNVQQQNCEVHTRLVYANDGQPPWFAPFRKTWSWRLAFQNHCQPNSVCSLQVPAGLSLQLQLDIAQYDKLGGCWWPPILTKNINARQGQVINLGSIRLDKLMPVFVQVLDSAGNAVPGVGVRHIGIEGRYSGQQAVTDEQGFARFDTPPHYRGQFRVSCRKQGDNSVSESVDYQTNGIEDANNVYTLQLSDKMVNCLFE